MFLAVKYSIYLNRHVFLMMYLCKGDKSTVCNPKTKELLDQAYRALIGVCAVIRSNTVIILIRQVIE